MTVIGSSLVIEIGSSLMAVTGCSLVMVMLVIVISYLHFIVAPSTWLKDSFASFPYLVHRFYNVFCIYHFTS